MKAWGSCYAGKAWEEKAVKQYEWPNHLFLVVELHNGVNKMISINMLLEDDDDEFDGFDLDPRSV